jgi:hypothetical protein
MSTDSGRVELEGLLSLINSATHDAMAIYEKSGHGVPSVYSATTHPLDAEAATLSLRKAIRTLEGACEQLCTTLAPPNHTLLNVRCSFSTQCPALHDQFFDMLAFYGTLLSDSYADCS